MVMIGSEDSLLCFWAVPPHVGSLDASNTPLALISKILRRKLESLFGDLHINSCEVKAMRPAPS